MTTTPTTQGSRPGGYALDAAWYAERERLASLTALYDTGSAAAFDRLGVAAGWRCLEIGAGTGSVVELLADRVRPGGAVVAVDVDTRFVEPLATALDGVEVHRADVTAGPLPGGGYDLAHARLLLEHLPARERVLDAMVDAVRPGGWVVVEDFDWATAEMTDPPSDVHRRVARACRQLLVAHGYDPGFGRRLPRALRAAGLVDVTTSAVAVQVDADPRDGVPQWELLVVQLAPALLASGALTEADLAAFTALLHDGETVCFAPLMVTACGRRPGELRTRG